MLRLATAFSFESELKETNWLHRHSCNGSQGNVVLSVPKPFCIITMLTVSPHLDNRYCFMSLRIVSGTYQPFPGYSGENASPPDKGWYNDKRPVVVMLVLRCVSVWFFLCQCRVCCFFGCTLYFDFNASLYQFLAMGNHGRRNYGSLCCEFRAVKSPLCLTPGVGLKIALHASPNARNAAFVIFVFPVISESFVSNSLQT